MCDLNNNMSPEIITFTGERYMPGIVGDIELEHLHRYILVSKTVAGKCVLDIACGEGYGSSLLAKTAKKVFGVDISRDAVTHAQSKYQVENIEFRIGSCASIPLEDSCIDFVVSFETVEHHSEHDAMMQEIKRVLRPNGVVIISSPDKLEYSDKPGYSNPYHVKELYREQFKKLIGSYFNRHVIYGQKIAYGSVIFCENSNHRTESHEITGDTISTTSGISHPIFLIAVASDSDLPVLNGGIFEQPVEESEVVKRWKAEVDGRDVCISKLEYEINRVKNTVSWRLTAPLRVAWNVYRKMVRKQG